HTSQNFEAAVIQKEFHGISGLTLAQKIRNSENSGRKLTGILISSGASLDKFERSLFEELGEMEIVTKPYQAIKVVPALHRTALRTEKSAGLIDSYRLAVQNFSKGD